MAVALGGFNVLGVTK